MKYCPPQKNNKGFIQHQLRRSGAGFTLIELLVVIGILAILLSIVLIAINPARQFGQANNTQRRSNVTAILNAIGAYAADKHGVLPTDIPTAPAAAVDVGTGNICTSILSTYISAVPTDPSLNTPAITDCGTGVTTGYFVVQDANHRVTVTAPSAENTEVISITR